MKSKILLLSFIFLFEFVSNNPAFSIQPFSKNTTFFVENKKQIQDTQNEILFYSNSGSNFIYLLKDRLSFVSSLSDNNELSQIQSIHQKYESFHSFRMDLMFLNCNNDIEVYPNEKADFNLNFYLGQIPDGLKNISSFKKITYKNLYDRIDLEIFFEKEIYKYNFILHPGSNINDIKLEYVGNNTINQINSNIIKADNPKFSIRETIDDSYLIDENGKSTDKISVFYKITDSIITFLASDYDGNKTLIIDPQIEWITYFAGSSADINRSVKTDSKNNVIVSGFTKSTDFPATVGVYQQTNHGGVDAFISKFSPSGKLIWCTYYGGNGDDGCLGLAISKNDDYWISGDTRSSNLPLTANAFQKNNNGGTADAWLAKFNSDGNLQFASYCGGEAYDVLCIADIDKNDNAFFYGDACSGDFPVTSNAYQSVKLGNYDAVLVKVSADGDLLYSSFYGGSLDEFGFGFALDTSGLPILSGFTASTDLIVTPDAYKKTLQGQSDAFLMKLDKNFHPIYCSYFGGTNWDETTNVAIDRNNNIILRGTTNSIDLPTNNKIFQKDFGGMVDFFIAKFSGDCVFQWCTYYGGSGNENVVWIDFHGGGVAVDSKGNIALSGITESNNLITTTDAISRTKSGISDAVVAIFDINGKGTYSTYLGGSSNEQGYSITYDSNDTLYSVGISNSPNFPVTQNAFQTKHSGDWDGYIVKFGAVENKDTIKIGITSEGKTILCSGDSVFLTADDGFVKYEWFDVNFPQSPISNQRKVAITKSGTYYVRAVTAKGVAAVSDPIKVDINSTSNILTVEGLTKDGFLDFDSTYYNTIVCRKLTLRNNSPLDYVLKDVFTKWNTNFSVPQSQFDLLIPGNSSRELEVCFSPEKFGKLFDSLFIPDLCSTHRVPLKGFALPDIHFGITSCDFRLRLTTAKLPYKNDITSGKAFPNPTTGILSVPYEKFSIKGTSFEPQVIIQNVFGNLNLKVQKEILSIELNDEYSIEYGTFQINVSCLPAGIYFMRVGDKVSTFLKI